MFYLIRVCHQDYAYHGLAAFFYLSAGVVLAYITFLAKPLSTKKNYQIDIAAVVRTECTHLLICIHHTENLHYST